MQPQQQSLIYLHIAVLLFGGTALFAKLIGLNALDITVYRTAIAGMAILAMLSFGKKQIKLNNPKDYLIALFLGVNSRATLGDLFCRYANGRHNHWYACIF
jgi:EamA-like transporter family.